MIGLNLTPNHIAVAVTTVQGVGVMIVICRLNSNDIASRVDEVGQGGASSQAATKWYEVAESDKHAFTELLENKGFQLAEPDPNPKTPLLPKEETSCCPSCTIM